jgi:hypothetical protein
MLEFLAANGNTSAMCMMMRRSDVFREIVSDTTYHADNENEQSELVSDSHERRILESSGTNARSGLVLQPWHNSAHAECTEAFSGYSTHDGTDAQTI